MTTHGLTWTIVSVCTSSIPGCMVCLDTGVVPIPFVFSSPSVPGDPGDTLENKPDWLDPGGVVRREGDP